MNWLTSRWALVVGIGLMVAVYVATQLRVSYDTRPSGSVDDIAALAERDDLNVLFVVIDTLRADRLGAYGYERDTSPGLDYLAETGARFDAHRAQSSWTKTSMASLWTSLAPARTAVKRFSDGVDERAVFGSERFKEAGYTTVGLWRNGWVAPNFGFDQGFDVYMNPFVQQAPISLRREVKGNRLEGTDIDVVLSSLEFMKVHRDERWFLYIHFMDVHQYVTVEELATYGNSYSDSYDHAIRWVDSQIRGIIQELDRLRLREKTLIVVVSDHGEAFGEHGSEGHAKDLHYEVTRTPFILSFPFRLSEGLVVEDVTQNVDVFPTVLELVGLPPLDDTDGRSRRGDLLGEPRGDDPAFDLAQLDRTWGQTKLEPKPVIAYREDDFRIVHHVVDSDRDALYDLANDPGEQRNLIEDEPDLSDSLRALALAEFEREPPWGADAPKVKLEDMNLKQLRALGYVIE